MIDLNYLRENLETARKRLADRGVSLDLDLFQRLDGERKSVIYDVEKLRQVRNTASEEIAQLVRQKVDVTEKRNEMKVVSQQIKEKEEALRSVEEKVFQFAPQYPVHPDMPVPGMLSSTWSRLLIKWGDPLYP